MKMEIILAAWALWKDEGLSTGHERALKTYDGMLIEGQKTEIGK